MLVKGSAATEGLSGSRSGAVCIPIDAPRSIVTRYTRTGRLMFLICCLAISSQAAARMAGSLRSTRSMAKAVLPYRMGRINYRLPGRILTVNVEGTGFEPSVRSKGTASPGFSRPAAGRSGDRAALQLAHAQSTSTRRASRDGGWSAPTPSTAIPNRPTRRRPRYLGRSAGPSG